MGLAPSFHFPCSANCDESIRNARNVWQLGREIRFAKAMDDLEAVLSWPMAWSSLHGIAEIVTPVFKATTQTDALAHKAAVEWRGETMPAEAGQGVQFPYEKNKV